MRRAVAVHVGRADKVKQAGALLKIANIELQGGDKAKCKTAVNDAQELYKSLGNAAGQASCMTTTMDILLGDGLYFDAVTLGGERAALLANAGERKLEAEAHLTLGKLLLDNKDFKHADLLSQTALTMLMELRDKDGASIAKSQIEAAKNQRVAAEIQKQIDANAHLIHMPDALVIDPGM